MNIHAADALMGIFGFKRVADDEIVLDNPPSLDDDSGSLNEGMKMEESAFMKKVAGQLEFVAWEVYYRDDGSFNSITRSKDTVEEYSKMAYDIHPLCRHSEALAGYAVRDARIAELEFELEVAKTDELSAAVWAATETIKHDLWDAQSELAAIKVQEPAIARFEKHAMKARECLSECDVVLLSSIRRLLAAPVAKQVVMQSTNFTASNGEQRNPRYQGQFEGETHDQAAYRLHWVTAAIESERLNAADQAEGDQDE